MGATGALALGLYGGSAALSAMGSLLGGSRAEEEALYQAHLNEKEARYTELKADWEIALSNEKANFELALLDLERSQELSRAHRRGARETGAARARVGKSGVAFSGSASAALAELAGQHEVETRLIEYNAAVRREALVRGATLEQAATRVDAQYTADRMREQARLYRSAGADAVEASHIQAGAGVLGTGTDFLFFGEALNWEPFKSS